MISVIRIFFIVALIGLASCTKNEFLLKFDLAAEVSANYRVEYYATAKKGGMSVFATAPVSKGKYELKGITRLPTLVYIKAGKETYPLVVYAEKGNEIVMTGKGRNPLSWEVSGNDFNKTLTLWRLKYEEILTSGNAADVNSAVEEFIRENPEDPVATIILLTYFSRVADESLFRDLWGTLKGEAASSRWMEMIGRADIPSPKLSAPARLRSAVMRSAFNGRDTIRTDSALASILFFWTPGMTDRKVLIDSLRILSREYRDSSSRIIADICLEADSISWKMPLRTDSLTGVARLWAPAGFADKTVMKLGVGGVPFFIVISNDGNQVYRGKDISMAIDTFRREFEKADSIKKCLPKIESKSDIVIEPDSVTDNKKS